MRTPDKTRNYLHKRATKGKATREIRRQPKQYLTRTIFKLLTRTNALAIPARPT